MKRFTDCSWYGHYLSFVILFIFLCCFSNYNPMHIEGKCRFIFFFLRSNAVYLICITHSAGLCPFTTQMWWIYQVLFWGGSKSRRTKNNFWVSLFFLVAPVAFIWAVLSSITGVSHLPLGLCDDAVLCGCKLLLVAGGRHVPVHAAGTFSVFWAKNFSSLSLHWLG